MNRTAQFFSEISNTYDTFIRHAVSRYDEMLWAMFYYVPPTLVPNKILELGCGTGIVTEAIYRTWPEAAISTVDVSADMLQKTKERLPQAKLTLIESGFEALDLPANHYDIVMTNLAVHHITHADKQALFQKLYQALKPGGMLVYSDQMDSTDPFIAAQDWQICANDSKAKGASDEDVQGILDHVTTYDKPASQQEIIAWLNTAGFSHVEVLWRYGFWSVVQAKK